MAAAGIKFGRHLKELRIHLCQNSKSSQGVRDFIQTCYVGLKSENPQFPILIRECSGTKARLWVRYELGKESSVPLDNLDSDAIVKQIKQLTQK